jgi:hypothetical protein
VANKSACWSVAYKLLEGGMAFALILNPALGVPVGKEGE